MAAVSRKSMQRYLDPEERAEAPGMGQIWNMNCEFCSTRKIKCSRERSCTHCRRRGTPCKYPSAAKIIESSERDCIRQDINFKRKQHDMAMQEANEQFAKPGSSTLSLLQNGVPAQSLDGSVGNIWPSAGGMANLAISLPLGINASGQALELHPGNHTLLHLGAQVPMLLNLPGDSTAHPPEHLSADGVDRPMLWNKSCEFCASRKIWCSREAVCNHCRRRDQPCKYPASAVLAADHGHDRHLLRLARRGLKAKRSLSSSSSSPTHELPERGEPSAVSHAAFPGTSRLDLLSRGGLPAPSPSAPPLSLHPSVVQALGEGGAREEPRGALREMNCDFCAARKIKCSREAACQQCRARARCCTYSRCAPARPIDSPGQWPAGPKPPASPPKSDELSESPTSTASSKPTPRLPEPGGAARRPASEEAGASPRGGEAEEGREPRVYNKSCDFCAARKIRCSREPSCRACRRRGQLCVYHPAARLVDAPDPARLPQPLASVPALVDKAHPHVNLNLKPGPVHLPGLPHWPPPLSGAQWPPPPAGPPSLSAPTSSASAPRSADLATHLGPQNPPPGATGIHVSSGAALPVGALASPASAVGSLLGPSVSVAWPPPSVSAAFASLLQRPGTTAGPAAPGSGVKMEPGPHTAAAGEAAAAGGALSMRMQWDLGCTSCSARKIKCGREEGQCGSCEKRGLPCVYPPTARLLPVFFRQPSAPGRAEGGGDCGPVGTKSSRCGEGAGDAGTVAGPTSPMEKDSGKSGAPTPAPTPAPTLAEGSAREADGGMDAAVDALVALAAAGKTRKAEGPIEDRDRSGAARISISQLV